MEFILFGTRRPKPRPHQRGEPPYRRRDEPLRCSMRPLQSPLLVRSKAGPCLCARLRGREEGLRLGERGYEIVIVDGER